MTLPRIKKWNSRLAAILIAAVGAFFVSQILIVSHAAKYGEETHKHDGQVCVLSLAAHSVQKAVTSATFVLIVSAAVWVMAATAVETEKARVVVRAARPRGPPHR